MRDPGPLDAPKFKDYILLLVFLKRLSDVFDDKVAHLAHEFGEDGIGQAQLTALHCLAVDDRSTGASFRLGLDG